PRSPPIVGIPTITVISHWSPPRVIPRIVRISVTKTEAPSGIADVSESGSHTVRVGPSIPNRGTDVRRVIPTRTINHGRGTRRYAGSVVAGCVADVNHIWRCTVDLHVSYVVER